MAVGSAAGHFVRLASAKPVARSTSRRLGQRLQISVDRKPDKVSGPGARPDYLFIKEVTDDHITTARPTPRAITCRIAARRLTTRRRRSCGYRSRTQARVATPGPFRCSGGDGSPCRIAARRRRSQADTSAAIVWATKAGWLGTRRPRCGHHLPDPRRPFSYLALRRPMRKWRGSGRDRRQSSSWPFLTTAY